MHFARKNVPQRCVAFLKVGRLTSASQGLDFSVSVSALKSFCPLLESC